MKLSTQHHYNPLQLHRKSTAVSIGKEQTFFGLLSSRLDALQSLLINMPKNVLYNARLDICLR